MAQNTRNKNIIIVAVIVIVVAIAAVIAIAATGGDDSSNTNTTSANGAQVSENQPVTVSGDPLAPFDTPENDTTIGTQAPGLQGFTFDGTDLSITPGATGRATMLVFLAHWCPHCNAEIPVLIEWKNSGAVPDSLDVFGVSTAVFSDRDNYPPSKWVADMKFPWPVMADSETNTAAAAYGVRGFPSFALVDAQGEVLYRADGQKSLAEINAIMDAFFTTT
jgi:thiol-disulfide isomerase/thioredoxin